MTIHSNDNLRPSMSDAELAAQLKREAEQTSPEFSELLHARVMNSIGGTTRFDAPTQRHWIRGRTFALAASLFIALSLAWVLGRTTPGPHPIAPPSQIVEGGNPGAPIAPLIASGVEARRKLEDELQQSRLAYLDRDTRKLATFVANQLSFGVETTSAPQSQ